MCYQCRQTIEHRLYSEQQCLTTTENIHNNKSYWFALDQMDSSLSSVLLRKRQRALNSVTDDHDMNCSLMDNNCSHCLTTATLLKNLSDEQQQQQLTVHYWPVNQQDWPWTTDDFTLIYLALIMQISVHLFIS